MELEDVLFACLGYDSNVCIIVVGVVLVISPDVEPNKEERVSTRVGRLELLTLVLPSRRSYRASSHLCSIP